MWNYAKRNACFKCKQLKMDIEAAFIDNRGETVGTGTRGPPPQIFAAGRPSLHGETGRDARSSKHSPEPPAARHDRDLQRSGTGSPGTNSSCGQSCGQKEG